jgi:hypothetical protein
MLARSPLAFLSLPLLAVACAGGSASDVNRTTEVRQALEPGDVTFIATELLGRPTDTSIVVNAITLEGVKAYVEYGLAPGSYTNATTELDYPDGMVELSLANLTPNTRYYYRMRYRPSDSEETPLAGHENTFHTQRAAASTFSFAVQSDSHQGYAPFYSDALYGINMANIAAAQPDFLIDLGDTFSLDGTHQSGQPYADDTEESVREKYLAQRTFFDMVGHSTPVFLVLGNHENEEGWNLDDFPGNPAMALPILGANARKRYFLNPVPDSFYSGSLDQLSLLDGDHLRENYYAFEWGDALFVAIDPFSYTMVKPFTGSLGGEKNDETTIGDRWSWTLGSAQYQWLRGVLEGSDKRHKFVFAHHLAGGMANYSRGGALGAHFVEWGGYDVGANPPYTFDANRPGWGKPIHQLFVDTGVTAFFHGHDHVYAQEQLDGIVYQEVPHAANDDYGWGFADNRTQYYVGADLVQNSGYINVTVGPTCVVVDYVRAFLDPEDNGQVARGYTIPLDPPDGDEDGVNDCLDSCVEDGSKTEPGLCGCGVSDADGDGDGTPDCFDLCSEDPSKTSPGVCGCGVSDADSDGDGTADCLEVGCSDATLVSDQPNDRARAGVPVTFTAGSVCTGGTAEYKFRIRENGVWRKLRGFSPSATLSWSTTGVLPGKYGVEVRVRRVGSTAKFESVAKSSFRILPP